MLPKDEGISAEKRAVPVGGGARTIINPTRSDVWDPVRLGWFFKPLKGGLPA